MSRSWPATSRYRLRAAPAGLALVQDLLNTLAIGEHGPDLLADGGTASAWANEAAAAWSDESGVDAPPMTLTDRDAHRLRTLRDMLRDLIVAQRTPTDAPLDATADLELSGSGRVRLVPGGAGARWLASAVWIEVLLSQQSSTWPRLKFCREPACGSAFYDQSRNNSGVWHDVKTCGNRANLRRSRARRKTTQA